MTSEKIVVAALIGSAALFVGGYALGRYEAPAKTVVTEKVVTVEKQVVVTQTKTEVQKVFVSDKDTKLHRVEILHITPDGTEEKTTTTDENVETVIHEQDVKYVDRWNERVVVNTQYVDRTKTVEAARPAWSFGVGAGVKLPDLAGYTQGYRLIPSLGPAVLQVTADHRWVGPVSIGGWATTSGEVGAQMRLTF